MAAAVANGIENSIRTTAITKGVRPNEFFLDYDRLRSGFVTGNQFFRVLWENLGIKLTEEEQRSLIEKYDLKQDGRVNYRLFCELINTPFNPNKFQNDPSSQTIEVPEFLGTHRSLQPVDDDHEARVESLLRRLAKYYMNRGINLRTCCEDFDWHHIGVIEESQFYRSFPTPPEVTEADIDLLVRKYRDPSRRGLMNYLNLHHDIEAIAVRIAQEDAPIILPASDVSNFLPPQNGASATLQQVFDKLQIAVFKNGVRTTEFFKDYDKLRSGIITENQFVCGLSLAVGKEAQLSRSEIQQVVDFYKIHDGRVRYTEFCNMMENAFNIPHLEKQPTLSVPRPPTGTLGRNLASLTEGEEQRLQEVLIQMSEQVRKRRLMMYQYFKDYDRSRAYSRIITATQFGRILHFLSLDVGPEDLKLICRKFTDASSGDINYPAFVQAVDQEFTNYTQDRGVYEEHPPEFTQADNALPETALPISLDDIIARVRHHVITNRRRVIEFFQDYDSLRTGSITKSQFRRGLSDLGLSALGPYNLTESQFQQLCTFYENPGKPDKVLWTRFMDDIERVVTQKNLDKLPTPQVVNPEAFLLPKSGTMDWSYASGDHDLLVKDVMHRLRSRVEQRRVLLKPVFQDFDRHNNGHITRPQFRQCLTILELNCTEPEMSGLEAKFCNDTGFNYLAFLSELQPQEPIQMMYFERLKEIRLANQKADLPEADPAQDLEAVLVKIRTKVFKERVRVHEWLRDYDKLRSGRMFKYNFRRALDLCKFELNQSEFDILEDHYGVYGYPEHIDYVRFSDDVEALFTTKNLEKAPQLDVMTFQPPREGQQSLLDPVLDSAAQQCMARLAERVRKNQMQLFPLFEDYDRVHNGSVSRSQFRRVLNELELAKLVATEQEWQALYTKFLAKVGGKADVNYNEFCDSIYDMAKFEWRKP